MTEDKRRKEGTKDSKELAKLQFDLRHILDFDDDDLAFLRTKLIQNNIALASTEEFKNAIQTFQSR